MKKNLLSTLALSGLLFLGVSCKNETKNETEANEAEEVAEASEMATTYKVMPEDSMIEWKGGKVTGDSHNGTIKVESGNLMIKDGMVEGGKVTVDMKSINSQDLQGDKKQNLEAHLMGTVDGKETDFFNVKKFPTATFEVTEVMKKDGKTWMKGNLTLKDITKNVMIPVETSMSGDNSEMKLISEKFTIDRTDWNVNYGSSSVFDKLGDNAINDDIELKISLKAKKA